MPAERNLPQATFLALGAACGLALVLLSPPFRWGDENSHFLQAHALSELTLRRELVGELHGAFFPSGVRDLISDLSRKQRGAHLRIVPWAETLAAGSIPLDPENRVFLPILRMPYSPLSHAPQALGIAIARRATDSTLALLLAARLANVGAWVAIVWLALRIAPDFRWPLCIIALAPMSTFLSATCATDALANGLALLWVAVILRLAAARGPGFRAPVWLGLASLGVALTLAKFVYGSLIAMILLVPSERFGGARRRAAITIGVATISAALAVAWLVWAGGAATERLQMEGAAATTENLRTILTHPSDAASVVLRTIANQADHWIRQLSDTHWGEPTAPRGLVWFWLSALALSVIADPPRAAMLRGAQRLVLLAIFAITFIAIILLAYVLWTSRGALEARGVQGRYLIPLLPLLLLAGTPSLPALSARARKACISVAIALASAALLHTCWRGAGLLALH